MAFDRAGTISTDDGRRLTYLEVGDTAGPLVIHNHGGPSSRLEAQLFANTASKFRLRLVCVDRPGIGESSRQRPRTFAGWAEDTTAVAEALGHREFGVTGWSEGGPWALAAAAYIDPARLRHVSCIAGANYGAFGEGWAAAHLSRVDAFGGALALRFTPGFRLMYAAIGVATKRFPGTFAKQLRAAVNDYDRRILSRPNVEAEFLRNCAECFANGSDGLVRDSEILYRAWDFDVTSIERPVHIWQGTDDLLVDRHFNEAVADRMPGGTWHPVQGAGHFVAIGSADDIFGIAAHELRA